MTFLVQDAMDSFLHSSQSW